MIEINDFVTHAAVEHQVIEAYRGRVPDDLIEIWEKYGYGSFAGGFLRVINPAEYEAEVGHCIGKTQGDGIAIPVMVTGLGDLITWEPSINNGALVCLQFRLDALKGLGRVQSLVTFANRGMLLPQQSAEIFPEAVAAKGELPFGESFVFVPLLSLGGKATVENLQKRESKAAIQVAVEFQGVIEH